MITNPTSDVEAGFFIGAESSLVPTPSPLVVRVSYSDLFISFSSTLHTESSSLLLYALMTASTSFSDAMSARSDLDQLTLPLLKNLYQSSARVQGRLDDSGRHQVDRTFRGTHQLYLIMIVLLKLSQEYSFGDDAFTRIFLTEVPWYKERSLKSISLGSLMILALLRSVTNNLNSLQDAYLLSNTFAVLLNLRVHAKCLHAYAAQRLVQVLVDTMKKATVARQGRDLYRETAGVLLKLVNACLAEGSVEGNVQLVYSLIHKSASWNEVSRTSRRATLLSSIEERSDEFVAKQQTPVEMPQDYLQLISLF